MQLQRVAIIYEDRVRLETTGTYCRRALSRLVDVEHLRPEELARTRASDFDLFLSIDDGVNLELPGRLRPSAYWAIDTHLDPDRARTRAGQFDVVFAAQRDGAGLLTDAHGRPAEWLPLACDPEIHGRQDTETLFDFSFVGHVFPGPRQQLLQALRDAFPRSFTGNAYFEDMARIYSQSRIVFNRSVLNDVNMRVFEALASGALLVTNDLAENGQAELFRNGVHCVTYQSESELLRLARHYLAHDAERERIAAQGRDEVLGGHTYEHRMRRVLERCRELLDEQRELRWRLPVVCEPRRRQKVHARADSGRHAEAHDRPRQPASGARPLHHKSGLYFNHPRPDVLSLIPESAQRVLDVGCGAGALGAALKRRQRCHVTGVERDRQAAAVARARLDRVIEADAHAALQRRNGESFDCILCADILEHLEQPLELLRRLKEHLHPDGLLIASIPNVRHHSVIRSLAAGNWTYESAGLLDEDHTRFFTRREFEKLLFQAGFETLDVRGIPDPEQPLWEQQGRPVEFACGRAVIKAGSVDDAQEFFTYQFLFVVGVRERLRRIIRVERTHTESPAAALQTLKAAHPWPRFRPVVPFPQAHSGWFVDGARSMLDEVLSAETRVVVELGSWLGASTRFIAASAPEATIVCIDHWDGSAEHQTRPEWACLLPQLSENFLALNWQYRERIIPLRATALDGIAEVQRAGLQPDVIYLDLDSEYESARSIIRQCLTAFPDAILTGDDFAAAGVAQAVREAASESGRELTTRGRVWPAWRLTPTAQARRSIEVLPDYGLTSIIIITHNQLPCTHECLESIRLRTDEPYEVIVVDNASTDGTPAFLRQIPDITLIENTENRGFPAAVNQGLAAASGCNLLLLNNDCVVTTGWLTRLLDALYSDPGLGMVGPYSNCVSGPQQIPVTYTQLDELDGFAWDLGRTEAGHIEPCSRLVGFCLLLRRELIERIGVLDERFGVGCFEDDDLCRRAMDAGFGLAIARDAFIHHVGGQTFRHVDTDYAELMRKNQQLFARKWGLETDESAWNTEWQPQPVWEPVFSETGGLRLNRVRIAVSLCMIVRDNEQTIGPCLESIRPWVDEMIIVDTGSTDRTPDICRDLGATVHVFPWCDDFSAARNASLQYARGEWVFWMDSDDTIPEDCGQRLRELAAGGHAPETLGYVMQVHCPGPSQQDCGDVTVVDHVKLFRNRPDLRFEGRIHEQILGPIRRAGGTVERTDIHVVHSGADHSPEGRKRKLERDYRLLQQDLVDRPNHTFVLFNLGMTYADDGRHAEAADALRRSILAAHPMESHLRKAYALLVSSLAGLNQQAEALAVCSTGLTLFPDDPELLFREAMLRHEQGDCPAAAELYRRLLAHTAEPHFASRDAGITGFKARHNLAIALDDQGQHAEAEEQWRTLLAERTGYLPAWIGLGTCLLTQGRQAEVIRLCGDLTRQPELQSTGLYLEAKVRLIEGAPAEACALLRQAVDLAPGWTEPLQELCRVLFEVEELDAAAAALRQLSVLVPGDGSVWHNLANVVLRLGRPDEALDCFRTSLTVRPHATLTRQQYAALLRETGRRPGMEQKPAEKHSPSCSQEPDRPFSLTNQQTSGQGTF